MKPTPISAGKGYRLLKVGTELKEGDQYRGTGFNVGWHDTYDVGRKIDKGSLIYRRRTAKTPSARKGK